MKIVAIGIGQCGCNIVDEFYNINNYARSFFNRRIEILTDAFAFNTDEADLAGLRYVPKDRHHRIIVGAMRTHGHGVGKMNVTAARIMAENNTIITDSVLKSYKFHESDAVILVASGGGGTGSGSIGWIMKGLRERITQPIYAIVVLPFHYEEKGDTSFAVTNTATCLEMVSRYANAVFLLDNDRFGRADISMAENFREINKQMVQNFYDLFCAGEERGQKYIGTKVVDAGDIKESLAGVASIGRGEVALSTFVPWRRDGYRQDAVAHSSALAALQQAENNLTLTTDMSSVRRILALVSAPQDIITLSLIDEISTSLQERSPKAVVRIGDYPRRGKEVSVTVIASQLTRMDRLETLYDKARYILRKKEEITTETIEKMQQIRDMAKGLPTLDLT